MKLSALSVICLGLALAACILSLGWFWYWSPKITEAGYYKEQVAALEGEIAKTPRAIARFENAEKMRDEQSAAWQKFVAQNTPPTNLKDGGIDLSVDPWRLAIDAPKYRDSAQKELNAQLRIGGVKVLDGPEIPMPDPPHSSGYLASYFNFPTLDYPIVIWELGSVHIRGTYKQIMANVRAWSHMKHYLAVVDGLTISGTSPQLEGSYNLVVVGFMKGRKFFGGVNEGTAPAAPSNSTAQTGAPGGRMGPTLGPPTGGGGRRGPVGQGATPSPVGD